MAELMVQNEISELVQRSEEAMENYPSQPYFYSSMGTPSIECKAQRSHRGLGSGFGLYVG